MRLPFHAALKLAFIPASIFLAACNTVSLGDERAQLSTKTSCCTSVQQISPQPYPGREAQHALLPSSPHFNFGNGLAPLYLYELPSTSIKRIGVTTHVRGASTLAGSGNDNSFRAPMIEIRFLNSEKRELPASVVGPHNTTLGVTGAYTAYWIANVPTGARFVLLTTDPSKVDYHHKECARPRLSNGEPNTTQCVTFPAGVLQFEWKGWMYGPLGIHHLDAS